MFLDRGARERERGATLLMTSDHSIHPCYALQTPSKLPEHIGAVRLRSDSTKHLRYTMKELPSSARENYVMGQLRILQSRFTSMQNEAHFTLRKEQMKRRDACPCGGYRLTAKK